MTIKRSKIRDSARGETCTFMLPGICNFNPETTVLCHAPHPDKGMGCKGPDYFAAYACSSCHDEIDGRSNKHYKQFKPYQHMAKCADWFHAIRETQRRLAARGYLRTTL